MPGPAAAPAQTPVSQSDEPAFVERDVTFEAADGALLAGVLLTPRGEGPFPGAVMIQGSGDSDRTNFWARSIAEVLARGGIVTLLPDKRGSGLSEGDWRFATFETLARDALAGVALVSHEPSVARGAVGLVGLSQGGHIAPLAATISPAVAWVVDISGATVPLMEQIRHEMRNTSAQAGLSNEEIQEIMEIQRLAEVYVEGGEWEPYVRALEAAGMGAAAEVAAGFPQTPESPVWTWARLNGTYDPLPYWVRVDRPILVVYGAEDEQDNVPVSKSVRRLEAALSTAETPDYTISVFPEAGHGLWDPASHHSHEPKLLGEFTRFLVRWIHERSS